jgi:hypothetical protein
MCNLYLMLYSELPVTAWCVDSNEWVDIGGMGGVPQHASLLPEDEVWAIPTRHAVTDSVGTVPIGQVAGVAASVGNDSSVWVLGRATRVWSGTTFDEGHRITKSKAIAWPVVMEVDRDSGSVLRSWGKGVFWMPHSIAVDREGNVWTVGACVSVECCAFSVLC